MKKTIYKYFFYEFLRYFATTLFALVVIIWTIQAVNFLDLVTEDGHAFPIYFKYSLLTVSKILTKLIPFCFLLSTVLTIIKFEEDNELLVLWTSGLNKIYIVNLIFRISLIVMFFQLIFTVFINPSLLNISRTIIKNSELQFVSSLLKEKEFNDTVDSLIIFVEEKDENNIYKNIFIRDTGKILSSIGDTDESSTIFARRGKISSDEKYLILHDGNIQKLGKDGNINIVKFKKTILNFAGISAKSISEPKMQETSSFQIIQCILAKGIINVHNCNTAGSLKNIRVELNKRAGMPLAIPLIALISSFLLSSRRDKKNYIYNKYIYFFLGFSLLTLLEILVRYSGISWGHTLIYYLVPLLAMPIFYIILIKKFKYENVF
jgi:lipopolysaccharide export system permease protein